MIQVKWRNSLEVDLFEEDEIFKLSNSEHIRDHLYAWDGRKYPARYFVETRPKNQKLKNLIEEILVIYPKDAQMDGVIPGVLRLRTENGFVVGAKWKAESGNEEFGENEFEILYPDAPEYDIKLTEINENDVVPGGVYASKNHQERLVTSTDNGVVTYLTRSAIKKNAWGRIGAPLKSKSPSIQSFIKSCLKIVSLPYEIDKNDLDEVSLKEDDSVDDNSHSEGFGGTSTQAIKVRRGQRKFRKKLLLGFENKCAITGCEIVDILEAAHIIPFKSEQRHHINNGLLLRSDIHTLFDLDLIGVDHDGNVYLSNKIEKEYESVVFKKIKSKYLQNADKGKLKTRFESYGIKQGST